MVTVGHTTITDIRFTATYDEFSLKFYKSTGRRTTYVKEYNKIELAISATVPNDSGIYQCVAVNPAGEIWAAGRLQVNTSRNSPAAPTSLKCHAVSPVRILISWEPPKSLPYTSITAYTVHYSPVGESNCVLQNKYNVGFV